MSLNVQRGKQGFQTTSKSAPQQSHLGAQSLGDDDREALLAQGRDGLDAAAAAQHGGNANDIWDGLSKFSEAYLALAADARARKKSAALARRRARYAARKAAGTLPVKQPKKTPTFEADTLDEEHRCACSDPGASPPCWHCTDCTECEPE